MTNAMTYAGIFQQNLDKQMTAKLTSGWMEANAGQVIYNGGKEVKIPHLSMQGLADYGRTNGTGFVNGDITFKYQTKEMTKDRGRSFQFDSNDVDETNFVLTAGNVLSTFQTTQVVPEVDAYRYSTLAQAMLKASANSGTSVGAITNGTTAGTGVAPGIATGGYSPAKATIFSKVKGDLTAIRDIIGDVPLVITMSATTLSLLEQADEISRQLNVVDFTKGDITTRVKSLDGVPIVEVPSSRFKTEYTFTPSGAGGFVATAAAADINWMIMPLTAPIAVSKTDKVRIFSPDTNQSADAWKVDYRKYHDVWITDEQLKLCRISINKGATKIASGKNKEEAVE